MASKTPATYVVEHLDPELGPWSELEYITIAKESHETGNTLLLSSLPPSLALPAALASLPAFKSDTKGVEELYADKKDRVCLLDPSASEDLSPEDGDKFEVFLFGGILGEFPPCFLTLLGWTGSVWGMANDGVGDDPPRGMCLCWNLKTDGPALASSRSPI